MGIRTRAGAETRGETTIAAVGTPGPHPAREPPWERVRGPARALNAQLSLQAEMGNPSPPPAGIARGSGGVAIWMVAQTPVGQTSRRRELSFYSLAKAL